MVEALVEYINDEVWFHPAGGVRLRYRKSPLMHPFWAALGAIERGGSPVLESLRWRRKLFSERLQRRGLSSETSDIDGQIEQVETLLRFAQDLRDSMFPASYGTRRELWHDVAAAVAPLVAQSYRAAGCMTVDFRTPTAAGVGAVRWSLEQLGYHIETDAIAQYFKRARKGRPKTRTT